MRFLADHDIVPVAYSPIGRLGDDNNGATNIVDDPLILELAAKYGKPPIQIVLNWGLCRGYAVIPRTSKVDH